MNTKESLKEMLTEDTGRHMLDSGGVYGRNWQRNKDQDFDSEPEASIDRHNGCISLSVYHFLKERLEYDEKIDSFFKAWGEAEPRTEDPWMTLSEEFLDSKDGPIAKMGFTLGGIYGDSSGPFITNTYNGEDLLSQVLQYHYATITEGPDCEQAETETIQSLLASEIDGRAFVLLAIHGGCDVRGGYTRPRFFWITDDDGISIFDNARWSLYCSECEARYDCDDGCNIESIETPMRGLRYAVPAHTFRKMQDWYMPKAIDSTEDLVNEDGETVCPNCKKTGTFNAYQWPVN